MAALLLFDLVINIVSLSLVNPILLILSLLWSLFSGGGEGNAAVSPEGEGTYCISDASSAIPSTDYARERECCITAIQGYTFAGSESSQSVSLRTLQSGRRSSAQAKSSFRFVKSGKVIDNKSLHPFLVLSFRQCYGLIFFQKYLHIICRLRI